MSDDLQRQAEANAEAAQRLKETDEQRLERMRAMRDERAEELKDMEKLNGLFNTITGLGNERFKIAEQNLEIAKLELKLKENASDEEKKNLAILEARLDAQRQGYNDAEGFAKRFFGISVQPSSMLAKSLSRGSDGLVGLGVGLAEVIDPLTVTTSAIDKVVEASIALTLETDKSIASFTKNTGQVGVFDQQIMALERDLFQAGVTTGESAEAFETLFLNVNDFTAMTPETQKELADTVAVLNELGIAGDTTSKNLQLATKVLGMTATEAGKFTREILDFSQDLGLSQQQVAEDLSNFGPMLAALGKEGPAAFKQLEVQVKATGLQMSELLQLTDQFNKFDTAAQSVGKLNALLGGPFLNTLELVNETNPAKRFELLKDGIDKAGLSFDQMDFYQKKALASAMGLNEQQLALMMRGRLDLVTEPAKSAREIEELAEATAKFQTLQEELQQTLMSLAVEFKGVLDIVKGFLDALQDNAGAVKIAIGVGVAYNGILSLMATRIKFAAAMEAIKTAGGVKAAATTYLKTKAEQKAGVQRKKEIVENTVLEGQRLVETAQKTGLIGLTATQAAVQASATPIATAFGLSLLSAGPAVSIMLALGAAILMGGTSIGITAAGIGFLVNALSGLMTGLGTSMALTATSIAEIVKSINELNTAKAVVFTTTMAPMSALAMSPIGAVAGMIGGATGGGGAAGGEGGASPTINITLSIDGDEISTAVNSVEVSKYNKGRQSDMYNSIVAMIEQGLVKG